MATCEDVISRSGLRVVCLENERQIPWLGLWINNRAWSGCGSQPHLNLGLEPSRSPCENLTEAIAEGWAEQLESGKIQTWSLSIEVGE